MTFKFEESAGYYLNRAALSMRANLQRSITEKFKDITVDYWVILNRLWAKDGWNQSELAMMTG